MEIEYDPAKDARNVAERGLPFERAREFVFAQALEAEDHRHADERRIVSIGPLAGLLHVLVYVRRGAVVRVISLRRANRREARRYREWWASR